MGKAEEWKVFFEDNHRYADLINGIGCGGVQFVKDTDLTEADPEEKKKRRDLLRKVAFGVNFVIIGIENQEKNDYEMPLRTLHYDVSRYQKQAKEIKKEVRANSAGLTSGEYLYGFKKDSKLNPIITFVLYAGTEKWDGPNSLHDMIDFTGLPESLKEMIFDYKLHIINIHEFENTDVFRTDVKQVFDFIRCSTDKEKLLRLVKGDKYYTEMNDDAFDLVTKYTNDKEIVNRKEYISEGGKNDMCKAIQDLMADSREEGREEALMTATRNLLDVLSDEVIVEKLGVPLQQVQELRRSLLAN